VRGGRIDEVLKTARGHTAGVLQAGMAAATRAEIAASGLIGRLEIPRLGVSALVVEGTTSSVPGSWAFRPHDAPCQCHRPWSTQIPAASKVTITPNRTPGVNSGLGAGPAGGMTWALMAAL